MTTRSTASHELPRTLPLKSPGEVAKQVDPEEDASSWTARIHRARVMVREATRGLWTPTPPVDRAAAPVEAVAAPTDSPPPTKPKADRQDDRTTSIYQRHALDAAVAPLLAGKDWTNDEVSTTSRLPSEHLEALLLQLQHDAEVQAAAATSAERSSDAIEMEVSSITFAELEAFRRSLGDHLPESDGEFSPTAPTLPPPALSSEAGSGATLRRLPSFTLPALGWVSALAARCARLLRDLGHVLTSSLVKLRTRSHEPSKPVPIAIESRAETAHENKSD